MALINQAMPQPGPPTPAAAPAPVPGAPPAAAAPAAGGTQQDYDKVVAAGAKAVYEPKVMDAILKMIKSAQSPAQGLLQATALIMRQLDEISKKTIPGAVKVPASKEIMGLIAEVAQKHGIIPDANAAVQEASAMIDQKSGGAPTGQFKPFLQE